MAAGPEGATLVDWMMDLPETLQTTTLPPGALIPNSVAPDAIITAGSLDASGYLPSLGTTVSQAGAQFLPDAFGGRGGWRVDAASAFKDSSIPNLKLAFWNPNFQQQVISQIFSLGTQALGDDTVYASTLGKSVGAPIAGLLTGGSWSQAGWAALDGVVSGAAAVGLEALGGTFDRAHGKNRWGLTRLQMAWVNFLGTSILKSPLAGLQSPEGFWTGAGKSIAADWQDYATNYATFGGTSPFATRGDRGFLQTQHIQKLAEFTGLSGFASDADRLMAQTGQSWKDLVKTGETSRLFPGLGTMFVNYGASTLHSAASA